MSKFSSIIGQLLSLFLKIEFYRGNVNGEVRVRQMAIEYCDIKVARIIQKNWFIQLMRTLIHGGSKYAF